MAETIKAINEKLSTVSLEDLEEALQEYRVDERAGVKKVVEKYERKIQKHNQLIEKYENMSVYEESFRSQDIELIAGIDEVGRGPLAGPVVTAAVILDANKPPILGLDDSKKLSEAKREELFDIIMRDAIAVNVGFGSVEAIDEINILEATKMAMKEAVNGLKVVPQQLLIDAVTLRDISIPQMDIIKGDEKSVSIAAASIIAKVTRDRMMKNFHEIYPHYHFAKNKGYGTADHIAGLKEQGACPIHRKSFLKNMDL